MQEGIHPEYGPWSSMTAPPTSTSSPSPHWWPRPLVNVEVSSYSHPFYTGKNVVIDAAGQVQKFNARYGRK